MKRWSSLQREYYKIVDENIDFQLHFSVYRMKSRRGSSDLPRYWISLGDDIIFDYPKRFIDRDEGGYPYETNIPEISNLIREYIDTPKEEIFSKPFENDKCSLIDILRAADRRFGKRRLEQLKQRTDNEAAQMVIERRLAAVPVA